MKSAWKHSWILACMASAAFASPMVDDGGIAGGACPADIDNSWAVSIDDLLAVINGWGSCAVPCPPYCAADIDDNCAVNINDLLAVINAWGPCPCLPDSAEPNQTCATARILASVSGGCNGSPGSTVTHSAFALAPIADVDHYRFFAVENCDCPCDLTATISLAVPASAGTSYSLRVRYNNCSATGPYLQVLPSIAPGATGTLTMTWDDDWGSEDSSWVYVEIWQNAPLVVHCEPYTLTYHLTEG